MAKLTLTDISNLSGNPTSAETAINANNTLIEAALENTLSRDGAAPNAMGADFDVNSNSILNNGTTGTFTAAANTATVVTNIKVTASSIIFVFPTNVAGGTLMGSSKSYYISGRSVGANFTVTTADGVAAAGTETFNYIING